MRVKRVAVGGSGGTPPPPGIYFDFWPSEVVSDANLWRPGSI